MKIGVKLWAGFGIGLVFISMIVLLGFGQFFQFNDTLQDLTESQYKKLDLTTTIRSDGNSVAKSMRDLLLADSSAAKKQLINDMEDGKRKMDAALFELTFMTAQSDAKAAAENLEQHYGAFAGLSNQFIKDIEAGRTAEAASDLAGKGAQIERNFFGTINELNDLYERGMEEKLVDSLTEYDRALRYMGYLSLFAFIVGLSFLIWMHRTLTNGLKYVSNTMLSFADGKADFSTRIHLKRKDEIGDAARAFNIMAQSLEQHVQEIEKQGWLKTNLADITTKLQGMESIFLVASTYIQTITPLVGGVQGVFYLKEEQQPDLRLAGSYAFKERKHMENRFAVGEGIIGQCALEQQIILLENVPSNYITIRSGLGESSSLSIIALPIVFEGKLWGVAEIASFQGFDSIQQSLLKETTQTLGIILDSISSRSQLAKLLEESQVMTEELQVQTEELQAQQEELRKLNEELEEQAMELKASEESLQQQQQELEHINADLEEQNSRYEQKNKEVEMAKVDLEQKANQLALSSKYKSEFLANMSHELRTPLNSLLILSKLLLDNPQHNLTEKQLEFARTIHSSGSDLLSLINEILDLAKVESGKIDMYMKQTPIAQVVENLDAAFSLMAEQKGITFNIIVEESAPDHILTDPMRLHQILNNLISNALKFTQKGHVTVKIKRKEDNILFSISDSGIGIPQDKLSLIFEAFQQVDGTTSRKYGGTGLGLSISLELARLLSGEIGVASEEGKGSTFCLSLPYQEEKLAKTVQMPEPFMILESRLASAAEEAEPVNEKSAVTIEKEQAEPGRKKLLVVEDEEVQRMSVKELMSVYPIDIDTAATGEEAMHYLKTQHVDCMILDLKLADASGLDFLQNVEKQPALKPAHIIIYTGREVTEKEERHLNKYTNTIIIKDTMSPERLLQETSAIFQLPPGSQPQKVQSAAASITDNVLKGKRVLLVDDDVRNLFSVSSILEDHEINVTFAENGKEALHSLEEDEPFDLILMDIMMPEMDGYETMQHIRRKTNWRSLPMIALTAKAMKNDREKCIEAGASDYIAKPIDPDQLIALLKVWLYGQGEKRHEA
ncbi:response regulator [Domibacillus robiginosus]|uniref:response regulator n=1 Tax=Domibacillus robiginosus TaxID=1071054 RepID=UPI00067BCD9A|nr:response regulator [Domibacillus robiginosus]